MRVQGRERMERKGKRQYRNNAEKTRRENPPKDNKTQQKYFLQATTANNCSVKVIDVCKFLFKMKDYVLNGVVEVATVAIRL